MRVYGYLRASTDEQDAERAKAMLLDFARQNGFRVSGWFVENESGATLKRPELFRLLDIAHKGDALLVEQVDRISRLNKKDWESLKRIITDKGIRIVSLDLTTSHIMVRDSCEFTERMFTAINTMLLDMLAAISRKDFEDRRNRQKQGIERAKIEGKYKGRQPDKKLHETIKALRKDNKSYSEIVQLLGCSRGTIAKVSASMRHDAN